MKSSSLVKRQLFPTTTCLLAVAVFLAYWTYLSDCSLQHQRDWLRDIVGQTSLEADRPEASLLSPEDHRHRPPQTVRHEWTVTTAPAAPDGVNLVLYHINEARSGDELEVVVHNRVDAPQGISLHWHGLRMKGANEMDGVVGLTQCAIGYNQTFTYRFRIPDTQHGTFWYHAHSGTQTADGLFGGLVVHEPADALATVARDYDAEQLLLIGDWYHQPSQEVLDWFLDSDNYGNDVAPDSLLINGRGSFECSMAVPSNPVDCRRVRRPVVMLYGQRTRLRVVNTGALAGFTLATPGQRQIRLISVDGDGPVVNSVPTEAVGVLYPGERMDLLIDKPASRSRSTLMIALDEENLGFKNFALTPTQNFSLQWHPRPARKAAALPPPPPASPVSTDYVDLAVVQGVPSAHESQTPLATTKSVLYTSMDILTIYRNPPVGLINGTAWLLDNGTALHSPALARDRPLLALDRAQWPHVLQPGNMPNLSPFGKAHIVRGVPWFRDAGSDVWLDLVINNLDERGHPFHLHGYSFHVLAAWMSDGFAFAGYNPFASKTLPGGPLNTATPLVKDTVYIPRAGYVVLRLRLDNPGLWMLHCHTLWHQSAGMGMALQIGPPADADMRRRAAASC